MVTFVLGRNKGSVSALVKVGDKAGALGSPPAENQDRGLRQIIIPRQRT